MSITLHFVNADGREQQIQAQPGRSLMKAAVAGGIEAVAADCGGTLSCATCHVFIDEAWLAHLPGPSEDEEAMLDMTAEPRRSNSRLSCQITLSPPLNGLRVRLPARQY